MRATHEAAHPPVPARDPDEAVASHRGGLGATVARRYADPVTADRSPDQPVGHRSNDLAGPVEPSPHHVGVTVTRRRGPRPAPPGPRVPQAPRPGLPGSRFGGTAEEHRTVTPVDPSGNVEVTHHLDPRLMY